eukprot:symbB.v1.2.014122.t1/scaffold1002.1/size145525/4
MQLLPTSFRALEADLGLSPTTLAASALMQSLTCASFSVFWGVLLDNGILSAQSVLFGGCTGWGVVTLLLATINDTSWIMVLRCFNGIALATLSPTTQTLIAELTPQQERGRAYSWSGFSMAMGCMTTAMVTTCISQTRLFGFQGWRVAFAGVGLLSIVLGYFVKKFVKRPNDFLDHSSSSSSGMSFANELRTVLSFFEVWTFSVIVVQGTFACLPWTAMSFGTMFLQYSSVPDLTAGCISGLMLFTASFGALLGGYISDALTKLSRFHGRPFTAQLSVGISVPTTLLYYHYVPHSPDGIPYWFVLVMVFGLCSPWCDHGVNRPMLSEVVAPQHRARILGVLCATAGTFGSLGGPLVALVSEARKERTKESIVSTATENFVAAEPVKTSFQAAMEAKDMIARAKVPTAPWPPQTSSKPKAKVNYQLQQHGDGFSVRHPVLGELEVPHGQEPEDFINRKLKTLRKAIRKQVEYYFSDLNWAKDEYLRSLADADGFVAIENIMDFKLLKQICSDFDTIKESLETSDLQLSACGNRLRKTNTNQRH